MATTPHMSPQAMTSATMCESIADKTKGLIRHGWKQVGAYWFNPRTNMKHTLHTALCVEALRGTFVRERRQAYDRARQPRPDRKPKGRPTIQKLKTETLKN